MLLENEESLNIIYKNVLDNIEKEIKVKKFWEKIYNLILTYEIDMF